MRISRLLILSNGTPARHHLLWNRPPHFRFFSANGCFLLVGADLGVDGRWVAKCKGCSASSHRRRHLPRRWSKMPRHRGGLTLVWQCCVVLFHIKVKLNWPTSLFFLLVVQPCPSYDSMINSVWYCNSVYNWLVLKKKRANICPIQNQRSDWLCRIPDHFKHQPVVSAHAQTSTWQAMSFDSWLDVDVTQIIDSQKWTVKFWWKSGKGRFFPSPKRWSAMWDLILWMGYSKTCLIIIRTNMTI